MAQENLQTVGVLILMLLLALPAEAMDAEPGPSGSQESGLQNGSPESEDDSAEDNLRTSGVETEAGASVEAPDAAGQPQEGVQDELGPDGEWEGDPFEVPLGQDEESDGPAGQTPAENGVRGGVLLPDFHAGMRWERAPFSPPSSQSKPLESYIFGVALSHALCTRCGVPLKGRLGGQLSYPVRLNRETGRPLSLLELEAAIQGDWSDYEAGSLFHARSFAELALSARQRQYTRHLLREVYPKLALGLALRLFPASEEGGQERSSLWSLALRVEGSALLGFYKGIQMEPLDRSDRAFDNGPSISWKARGPAKLWSVGCRLLRLGVASGGGESSTTRSGPYLDVSYGENRYEGLVLVEGSSQDRESTGWILLVGWTREGV